MNPFERMAKAVGEFLSPHLRKLGRRDRCKLRT